MTTMSLPMTQSCFDKRNLKDSIVLETESFKLTVGKDALMRSLIVKKTNKEMVLGGAGVPLFSATQERPFNNETKLQHPNTRTTYDANSLSWDGEKLTVGFDTAPYDAVVKVEKGAGYLRFILEDFICKTPGYEHLVMDAPPVAEFRILQLPVKERKNFGEWLNCMWDDASAICVAGCDPWSQIWHEDRPGGKILTADLFSGKKLRGGSAAIIAADGKEPFLDAMDGFEADLGLPRGVQSRRSPMLNRSIYWTSEAVPSNIDQIIAVAQKAGLKMMLFYYPCFVKSKDYKLLGDYDLEMSTRAVTTTSRRCLTKLRPLESLPASTPSRPTSEWKAVMSLHRLTHASTSSASSHSRNPSPLSERSRKSLWKRTLPTLHYATG